MLWVAGSRLWEELSFWNRHVLAARWMRAEWHASVFSPSEHTRLPLPAVCGTFSTVLKFVAFANGKV